jgi:hypothetical protein
MQHGEAGDEDELGVDPAARPIGDARSSLRSMILMVSAVGEPIGSPA